MLRIEDAPAAWAPVLAAIHAEAFDDDPWSAEALAELLRSPGVFARLAARDDAPEGFVLARVAADEAEILTLAVRTGARRAGVGRALMAAAADRAAIAGARRLLLEVADDNLSALGLYAALGFAEVGRRPAYYARSGGAPAAAKILAQALDASS